jgi:hypothetical protein
LTSPLQTFSIPQIKNYLKRKKISNSRGHNFTYDKGTERNSTNILQTVLPKVEKAMKAMHCCSRKVLCMDKAVSLKIKFLLMISRIFFLNKPCIYNSDIHLDELESNNKHQQLVAG